MALVNVIGQHLKDKQLYVDCSQQPVVEVTMSDLFQVVMQPPINADKIAGDLCDALVRESALRAEVQSLREKIEAFDR